MNSGIYNLIILLRKDTIIIIGKLGKFSFPKGYYVYTGSAKKNLLSRIERHKRKDNKRLKWHIDYLLNCKYAEIKNVRIYNNGISDECSLNKKIMKLKGAKIIVKGFGSSDCKNKCPAHLVYFKDIPKYFIKKWIPFFPPEAVPPLADKGMTFFVFRR